MSLTTSEEKKKFLAAVVEEKQKENDPATFEQAIEATKFGKFNLILALVSLIANFTISMDTGSMSYASLGAQCDLNLTLADKGMLNAVIYAGMVTSASVWGVLVDVLGRKKLLITGLLCDFFFVCLSAVSQDLTLLAISKFFQGFMVIGPFAALSSYVAEFQMAKHRPSFLLMLGCSTSIGSLFLPLLAWALLPQKLTFQVFQMTFHSWNIFLLLTGLPALVSGIAFIFLPESPKYLIAHGRRERALSIMGSIFRINTHKPKIQYPIRNLAEDVNSNVNLKPNVRLVRREEQETKAPPQGLKAAWFQMKPLFLPPYLWKIILICLVTGLAVTSQNTFRLWTPQLFQAISDYQALHNTTSDLCSMLDMIHPIKNKTAGICVVNVDDSAIYIRSMLVQCVPVCSYALAIVLVPRFQKKYLVCITLTLAGLSVMSIYYARNPGMILAGSALFSACSALSGNFLIAISVELFPTSLRTLANSLALMMGRAGAVGGNYLFPLLLEMGCQPPFFVIGGFFLAAAFLSIFIPKSMQKTLS